METQQVTAQTFPAVNLQPSQNGMHLTEDAEACKLTAYPDQGGVWTIGYGHTGPDVYKGLTITKLQAENLLLIDYRRAVAAVQAHVTVPVTQNEFDALGDFVFNVGAGNFAASTLLRDLNEGNFAAAAQQFLVWDHVKGKVVAGLLNRRTKEQALFNS